MTVTVVVRLWAGLLIAFLLCITSILFRAWAGEAKEGNSVCLLLGGDEELLPPHMLLDSVQLLFYSSHPQLFLLAG